jgi:hypothetical protein
MSDRYHVGVCNNETSYSLTIRCPNQNPNWIFEGRSMWNPTRPNSPHYTIVFSGDQTQAQQFSHVIRAAYAMQGVPTLGSQTVA